LGAQRAQDVAIGRDDQLLLRFSDLAKSCDAYLAVPVLEKSEHDMVYNAVVLFGRNGARVGSYTKRIPWPSDPGMSEFENGVAIGAGGGPFKTDGGLIGIQTCFEINWPSGWQALRQAGVKLVLFPSEQPGGKILGYRAWEARSYVLSAVSKGGPSQLRDPLGDVVASWSARTRGPVATLSLDYELVHLDHNEAKLRSLAGRLRGRARFKPFPAERVCLDTSLVPQLGQEPACRERHSQLDEYLQTGARRQGRPRLYSAYRADSAPGAPIRSISVVVPTTGKSPMLGRCLHALQSQAVGIPVDIVLVVNGDGCDSFQCPVPGVSIIREAGIGPAVARNRGVTESKGDCIAFIDDDCIASALWLTAASRHWRTARQM
jgi:predicted amidohydrolase